MKLRRRFTILLTLIIVFSLIAPVVIFAALGYRLDFNNWRFVMTGTVEIKTLPKGAGILLNDKEQKQKTPARLKYIIPGDYEVTLKKEGYKNWQKLISVLPNQVTFVHPPDEKVVLFLENPKSDLFIDNSQGLIFLNNLIYSWSATSTFSLTDLVTKQNFSTPVPFLEPYEIQLTANSNWILFKVQNKIYAYNLSKKELISLPSLASNIQKIEFLKKNHLVFHANNGNLYQFNLSDKSLQLRGLNVTSFSVVSEDLYIFKELSLIKTDAASTTAEILVKELPEFKSAKIIQSKNNEVFLLLDNSFFVIRNNLTLVQGGVNKAFWDTKSERLILNNENTIWILNPNVDLLPEVITRSNNPVKSVQINKDSGHIFYLLENKILGIEIEGQPVRNIINLIEVEHSIENFYIDPTGQNLYYYISGQGLYKTRIR